MLDLGGEDAPLPDCVLPYLSYITANETELERLVHLPTETIDQVKEAALAVQKKGVRNVLVSLGSRGSLLLNSDGEFSQQVAFNVVCPWPSRR